MTARPRVLVPRAAACLAALALGWPSTARAHDPGLSSLDVLVTPQRIVAVLSMATADARLAECTTNECLAALALTSIELLVDGVRLDGAVQAQDVDGNSADGDDGVRMAIAFERMPGSILTVRSSVPARLARGHRQLLTVRGAESHALARRMLDASAPTVDIALDEGRAPSTAAGSFLALGVRHILGGFDHLIFLAALLLGVRRLGSVIRIVTAFTAAHSLTLSLAVLGIVQVPAAVVEPLIAASIVFVGLENLLRGQMDSRWKLTFAFGLVHGFGFAGALQELGVGGGTGIAVPLGLFNAGVEAGQLGVVVLLWPLIRQLNTRPGLRTRLAPACSLLVVAAGTYWILERTLT